MIIESLNDWIDSNRFNDDGEKYKLKRVANLAYEIGYSDWIDSHRFNDDGKKYKNLAYEIGYNAALKHVKEFIKDEIELIEIENKAVIL